MLLPLLIPLGIFVVGIYHLSVSQELGPGSDHRSVARIKSIPSLPPDYTQTPQGGLTCSDDPQIAESLLVQGHRLGVSVVIGIPELPGRDASYRAEHGRLGKITLRPRPMSPPVRCLLISHEFIHVLQHLNGDLRGVPALGWNINVDQIRRFGSRQEAEAYVYQNSAEHVLGLLKATERPR